MIYDLTYNSREVNRKINASVGEPFALFSKVRWSGIGSERLAIINATGELNEIFSGRFNQNFANIELRPRGVIIRVRYRLELYGVVVPYPSLILLPGNPTQINIQFEGDTLSLRNYHGRRVSQRFISKLLNAKAAFQDH